MRFTHEVRPVWKTSSKLIFRAIAIYCIGYILLMFTGPLLAPLLKNIALLLGVEGVLEYQSTGSGDTTLAYLSLFLLVILTAIGTFLWSLLDRKRPSYNQFFYWLTVLLRIFLVCFMLIYGFAKIFKTQFPGPSLVRLLQPLGDFSPMGLAWTYMGHSEGFNIFVGGMEVLGGLLLIPRKTVTLGAFVTLGVMVQVAMMNFFFDIPVKLFSVHLALMALVLLLADSTRFTQVFITNKTAPQLNYYKVSTDAQYLKLIFWFKTIALFILVGFMSYQGYQRERSFGDKREKPLLYGIWETTTFAKNGILQPPLITDRSRWRYLIIDRKGSATIKFMDDRNIWYDFDVDASKSTLDIYRAVDSTGQNTFNYSRKDSILTLNGIFYKDSLNITLKAKDLSTFTLTNRGFHWVNEFPNNQ